MFFASPRPVDEAWGSARRIGTIVLPNDDNHQIL
jgi:hypothetical protein